MQNLTKRPFSDRDLLRLLLPLIVEMLLAVTVGLADSLMVARLGEAAVSSVSIVDTVNVLLINLFSSMATGGAIVTGQHIGAHAMDKAQRSAEQLLLFMAAVSLGVTVLMYALRRAIIFGLFGAMEADVAANSVAYFNIVELSVPFLAVYSVGAALFRVMGDSKTSMKISLYMNLINVAGNALLIFVFKWGVAGVAVPTLVSRMFAAAAVLWLLRNPNLMIRLSRDFRWSFDRQAVGQIVTTGVPNGIEGSLFQLGKIMLVSVAAQFGTAAITANAIGNTLGSFHCLPGNSVGMAMITVISQCVGRGDYDDVRYYTKRLLLYACVSMAVFNAFMIAITPSILDIYNVSAETWDLAWKINFMHAFMCIFIWSFAFTYPQALRAAGDTRFIMVVSMVSMWVFRLGLGVLLATRGGYGVLGIWLAMFADWIVRIVCFTLRWRSGKWMTKAVK